MVIDNKKISNLKSYVDHILGLREATQTDGETSAKWFFRGQKCSQWSVRPNIFRGSTLKNEFKMIEEASRQRPSEFKENSKDFNILTKLQHYGLGTRLLDVTLNPLVALYFATEEHNEFIMGKDKRGKMEPQDGRIFYKYAYFHSLNAMETRIACALPFIDFTSDFNLDCLCETLENSKVISLEEKKMLCNDNFKSLIETIQKSYFVVTSHSNDRLMRQSGAFIVPTAIKIINDSSNNLKLAKKAFCDLDGEFDEQCIIVPSSAKESIRDELDFFNINEATLFPELEHQMQYIQRLNVTAIGSVEEYEKYAPSVDTETVLDTLPEATYTPDILEIVEKFIENKDESLIRKVVNLLNEQTSIMDWQNKESVHSKIRLELSKALTDFYNAEDKKRITTSILENLLNPPQEFATEENI